MQVGVWARRDRLPRAGHARLGRVGTRAAAREQRRLERRGPVVRLVCPVQVLDVSRDCKVRREVRRPEHRPRLDVLQVQGDGRLGLGDAQPDVLGDGGAVRHLAQDYRRVAQGGDVRLDRRARVKRIERAAQVALLEQHRPQGVPCLPRRRVELHGLL